MNRGPLAHASTRALTPHPKRSDWYVIPRAWAPDIAMTGSMGVDPRLGPLAHRSHLPLLAQAHPEVENFLSDLRSRERLGTDRPSDRDQERAAFDATTDANGWKLRAYQHVGREFIRGRRGTLLGDAMRVGKTSQIVASHDEDLGPMLVVAPLATREVWLSWFKRRWPDERAIVLQGRNVNQIDPKKAKKPRKPKHFDVLEGSNFDRDLLQRGKLFFVNYDILGAWKDLAGRQIGTLVLDEIHMCSQRNSRRALAATFAGTLAQRVIGATGTPVWNRPSGLFTTLSAIAPAAFGTFHNYATRYCDAHPGSHGWVYDGSSNEEEFRARMAEVMLRRTWLDVSGEMPAIERAVEVVDITEEQQFQIEREAECIRDHGKMTTTIGALARFRRLLAKLKLDATVDCALRILQTGEKVVIWTWHRDVAQNIEAALGKKGFPGFVVSGSTPTDTREAIFERWRKIDEPMPLALTLSVGQVGIDLSAAKYTVFGEIDFTPSVVAQAEVRTFSLARPMSATYIIIDHEIERKILAALSDKCEVAYRLGVPAAESTVGVLATAFARAADGPDDFDALAKAIMMDHPDLDERGDGDYHGAMWDYDWEAGE